jgi:parallel beta-helix repeat protein
VIAFQAEPVGVAGGEVYPTNEQWLVVSWPRMGDLGSRVGLTNTFCAFDGVISTADFQLFLQCLYGIAPPEYMGLGDLGSKVGFTNTFYAFDGLVDAADYALFLQCYMGEAGQQVIRSEDYPTIQAAIGNATAGETVLIAPGIYNESVVVDKPLTIIGLPGSAPTFNGGGSGIAITLLWGASGSVISGIVITNWDQGILIIDATNVKIYDNIMSLMNSNGITLEGNAGNNLIYSNIFRDSKVAVNLTASSANNAIYKNIISSNNIGLSLESSGHTIYANTISENQLGINISNSDGNIIYHNNFINNIENAKSGQYSNAWDNGYPSGGNFWSDYTGLDYNGDGIGDTQYAVAVNIVDRYPLIQPFNLHDIGLGTIASKTITGQGFNLLIELKILNYGICNETFTITAYAGTIIIGTQTITLESRNSCIITFTWNTAGFVMGNYTINAYAWPVQDETDTTDNTCTGNSVQITKVGDIGSRVGGTNTFGVCDGVVTSTDLSLFLQCYKATAPASYTYLGDFGSRVQVNPGPPPVYANVFFVCDRSVTSTDLSLFLQCYRGLGP